MTHPLSSPARQRWVLAASLLFLLVAAMFCLSRAVDRGLNHDEHQFVAPAVLLARDHLLPYRDVALFHQPYLTIIYAVTGGWTQHPLLMARLVSGAAATATAALLFWIGWTRLGAASGWRRFFLPALIVSLWLSSELFLEASGRTWNHDLPTLLGLMALALILTSEALPWWKWLLAGLCAGLAVGTRLTFAPFALALAAVPLVWPGWPWRRRLGAAALCALGVLVALLPSLWLLLQDQEAYVFGNFTFPRLPMGDENNSRILKTVTPWRKLRYFFKEIVLSNWAMSVAFLLLAVPALWRKWTTGRDFRDLLPLLLGVPILAGCFAPSRYEYQHFYALVPFTVLALVWALPMLRQAAVTWLLAGLCVVSGWENRMRFETAGDFFEPSDWMVSNLHRQGEDLREKVADGHDDANDDVLTLSPIIPLEGGLEIYPGLATGPFGSRYAKLVEPGLRLRVGLFAPVDLEAAMQADPPEAILTGYEKVPLEKEIIEYAKQHGFVPQPFEQKGTLWLPGK